MKDSDTININPEVLVWARQSLVLSKNQASERTKINPKRLNHLESGEKLPTLDELRSFSKAYKRTIATLLLQNTPKEKPLPKDRRTINSSEIGSFHEKTIMAVRKARALALSYLELRQEMNVNFPKFDLKASMTDSPQVVADSIRKILKLDELRGISNINFALEGYIEKVESLGIAIFQLSLTQDDLRGFSITDDIIPIIGIKRGSEQAHSKTFTLFHELGHVLLNEGGLCDMSSHSDIQIEKWCNSFSAGVLVPSTEFLQMHSILEHQRQNQKIWDKKELIKLALYFHVGPLTILRSLLEHNLTTKSFYSEKHKAWNKPTFGRSKEPKGREMHKESFKERGRTYISLAFSAYDQNRIDMKDLSDFLGLRFSYIPKTRALLKA
ncbi:MAG: XRE family transcriptional regulator [Bacteroidetes bacterium]|nr:XRE family transcriptional regulator [Bacteroidota bacterium]